MQGRGNHLLMGNTLLSIAQIALSTTAERGGRRPGGGWRPEARHDLKNGSSAAPRCLILVKGTIMSLVKYMHVLKEYVKYKRNRKTERKGRGIKSNECSRH